MESVTLLFVDIVGSTATMTRVGDDAADVLRRRAFEMYHETTRANGGVVVKTTGDGAMSVFKSSALGAVAAGVAMVERSVEQQPISHVRVGIASGDAANEDGDWYGTPVVLASRLCDAADSGQVLISATTRTLIGSRGDFRFAERRPMRLKGLPGRTPVFAVASEGVKLRRHLPRWTAIAATAVAVVAGLVAVAYALAQDEQQATGRTVSAGVEATWDRPEYEPVLEERDCRAAESSGDKAVVCSTLIVPVDRTDPDGDLARLEVTTSPTTGSESAVPLVNLLLAEGSLAGSTMRPVADVMSLTIRGTAAAEPSLTCPEIEASRLERLTLPAEVADVRLERDLDACHQRLVDDGIVLSNFDQLDAADDIRDLAVALGVEQVDVVAGDKEAVIALAAVRLHPGLVRSLTLFDPLPLSVNDAENHPGLAAAQFERYVEVCVAQATVCDGAPPLDVSWSSSARLCPLRPSLPRRRCPTARSQRFSSTTIA